MKTPGLYVPLDVNYVTDEGIRRAGPAAELLYIRGLTYSKRTQSDGFLPDYDMPVISVGLPQVRESIEALVDRELWLAIEGGWQIRSWRRWNEAHQDAADKRKRAADRQRRNRERKAAAAAAAESADTEGEQSAGGRTQGEALAIARPAQQVADEPVTRDVTRTSQPCHTPKRREEKTREETTTTSLPQRRAARTRATADAEFDKFWSAYPKRKEKPAAIKAYQGAIKDGATPEQILTAATVYAGERFGQNPRFTKLPATWLNKGCWADEPDTLPEADSNVVRFPSGQTLAPTGTDGAHRSTTDDRVAGALALAAELYALEQQGAQE